MIYIDYLDESNDAVITTSEPDELFEKMKGYFSEGNIHISTIEDYNSNNTNQLTIEDIKEKLSQLPYIKQKLK